MKTLITAADVRLYSKSGAGTMTVEAGAIITPAAWDEARELSIAIVTGAADKPAGGAPPERGGTHVDPAFLARVVEEVVTCLQGRQLAGMVADADPSGLRLIRQDRLAYAGMATGSRRDNVRYAEVTGPRHSSQLSVRSVKVADAAFAHEETTDAFVQILAGNLECTINGRKYQGGAGDSFFIPARQKVCLATQGQATCLIVAAGEACNG